MTPKEWLAKHYPVPASEATGSELEAARHSLRKWEGLTSKARGSLLVSGLRLLVSYDSSSEVIRFNVRTCALCQRHLDGCERCVLYQIRDGVTCFREDDEGRNPYESLKYHGDPLPMIRLLRKAVKELKREEGKAEE